MCQFETLCKTQIFYVVFLMCVFMLMFATLCQHNLIEVTSGSKASQAAAITEMNEICIDGEGDTGASGTSETKGLLGESDIEAPSGGGTGGGGAVDVGADSKGD